MFRGHAFRRERFMKGPWRESSFQKGDLKYVILDLIKDKPRHGYEIIRELEEMSHGLYTPSPGAVYPTLQMLEELPETSETPSSSIQPGLAPQGLGSQSNRYGP